MKDKVALVTGANTGIGFEVARGLLERGATVVLGCRDLKRGEAARVALTSQVRSGSAVLMQVDLANLSRLRNFVTKFTARASTDSTCWCTTPGSGRARAGRPKTASS
jgi:NAD(P)-dependent dehydrogenase (short-subunit alcohol dehydrogenase family)